MFFFFYILFIALLIVILGKYSKNLGLNIFLMALSIGLLTYPRKYNLVYDALYVTLDPKVNELAVIIVLIYFLSNIIKISGRLKLITDGLKIVISDEKLILISLPALVGLIPMPGGAMFTAPITDEVGNKIQLSQVDKTFSNYWFRHCWELAFPLYPGIILASALIKQSPNQIAIKLFPLCITAFLVGIFVFFRRINYNSNFIKNNNYFKFAAYFDLKKFDALISLWPIFYVVAISLLKISLAKGLLFLIIILIILDKVSFKKSVKCFVDAININVLFLIWSVFYFGKVLNNSGLLIDFTNFLINNGIPILLISFVLPFIIGIATGVTTAFVGIIFPVLLPLWKGYELNWLQFAYASGLAGVFLSPAHLCFSLTNEYFGSKFSEVLKLVMIPTLFIIVHSLINLYLDTF